MQIDVNPNEALTVSAVSEPPILATRWSLITPNGSLKPLGENTSVVIPSSLVVEGSLLKIEAVTPEDSTGEVRFEQFAKSSSDSLQSTAGKVVKKAWLLI